MASINFVWKLYGESLTVTVSFTLRFCVAKCFVIVILVFHV